MKDGISKRICKNSTGWEAFQSWGWQDREAQEMGGGIHAGLAGTGCGVDLSCPVEGGEAAQTLASLENQAEELG